MFFQHPISHPQTIRIQPGHCRLWLQDPLHWPEKNLHQQSPHRSRHIRETSQWIDYAVYSHGNVTLPTATNCRLPGPCFPCTIEQSPALDRPILRQQFHCRLPQRPLPIEQRQHYHYWPNRSHHCPILYRPPPAASCRPPSTPPLRLQRIQNEDQRRASPIPTPVCLHSGSSYLDQSH